MLIYSVASQEPVGITSFMYYVIQRRDPIGTARAYYRYRNRVYAALASGSTQAKERRITGEMIQRTKGEAAMSIAAISSGKRYQ